MRRVNMSKKKYMTVLLIAVLMIGAFAPSVMAAENDGATITPLGTDTSDPTTKATPVDLTIINDDDKGTVTVDPANPAVGETMKVTVDPKGNYRVKEVKFSGCTLKGQVDQTRYFVIGSEEVTLTVVYCIYYDFEVKINDEIVMATEVKENDTARYEVDSKWNCLSAQLDGKPVDLKDYTTEDGRIVFVIEDIDADHSISITAEALVDDPVGTDDPSTGDGTTVTNPDNEGVNDNAGVSEDDSSTADDEATNEVATGDTTDPVVLAVIMILAIAIASAVIVNSRRKKSAE